MNIYTLISVVLMVQSMVHSTLERCQRTLYRCRNKMIMHTAVDGLRTIDPYLINCTVWKYIPDRDHGVDESSASGVGP